MPIATEYLPDDRGIREAAETEFRERQKMRERNAAYYSGKHKKPLKKTGEFDDNVIINLCRQAVDRTIAFLVDKFPQIEMTDGNALEYAKRAWRQDHRDAGVLLKLMSLNGAVDGQVFVRLVRPAGTILRLEGGRRMTVLDDIPRMILMDAGRIVKFVAAGDTAETLWYEIRWSEGRVKYRQDIVAVRDALGNVADWIFYEYVLKGSRWELTQEVPWGYPLGPIVDWQHLPVANAIYGEHEFGHAEMNDQVNKVASDINRILRFYAYPKDMFIGIKPDQIKETAINDAWSIDLHPNDFKHVRAEMSSDLSNAMNYLDLLTDSFFKESRVHVPRARQSGPKTAFEVRLEYADQIDKNETLQAQYTGGGIVPLTQRILMLGGFPYQDVEIGVEWSDPLPVDPVAEMQVAAQLMNMGASRQTAFARMGLDWLAETERRQQEMEIAVEQMMLAGDLQTAQRLRG